MSDVSASNRQGVVPSFLQMTSVTAYKHGIRAAQSGMGETACPYVRSSIELRRAWMQGHRDYTKEIQVRRWLLT